MAWKAQGPKVARAGTMGTIPDSLLGHPSTTRTVRVSQSESVAILAGKRGAQQSLVRGRVPMSSGLKQQGVNVNRTMAEQNRGAAALADARVR